MLHENNLQSSPGERGQLVFIWTVRKWVGKLAHGGLQGSSSRYKHGGGPVSNLLQFNGAFIRHGIKVDLSFYSKAESAFLRPLGVAKTPNPLSTTYFSLSPNSEYLTSLLVTFPAQKQRLILTTAAAGTRYLPGGVRFRRGRWQPSPWATVPCQGAYHMAAYLIHH